MIDLTILLQGLVLGFSIAAPVGPIGLLCINRTLNHGKTVGFLSGLGAATADMVYGMVAAFGVTAVSVFLVEHHRLLQIGGGLFLLYFGYRLFRSKPAQQAATAGTPGLVSAWLSTFALTLTNPMTILAFAGIFTGLGLGLSGSYTHAALLVAGVFAGSLLWWLLLSLVVGHFCSRFHLVHMVWVNRVSGIVLIGLGVISLVKT